MQTILTEDELIISNPELIFQYNFRYESYVNDFIITGNVTHTQDKDSIIIPGGANITSKVSYPAQVELTLTCFLSIGSKVGFNDAYIMRDNDGYKISNGIDEILFEYQSNSFVITITTLSIDFMHVIDSKLVLIDHLKCINKSRNIIFENVILSDACIYMNSNINPYTDNLVSQPKKITTDITPLLIFKQKSSCTATIIPTCVDFGAFKFKPGAVWYLVKNPTLTNVTFNDISDNVRSSSGGSHSHYVYKLNNLNIPTSVSITSTLDIDRNPVARCTDIGRILACGCITLFESNRVTLDKIPLHANDTYAILIKASRLNENDNYDTVTTSVSFTYL